jgi:Flp pilus assembly protein TadD
MSTAPLAQRDIAPLQLPDREMKAFVERYTADLGSSRQRLIHLHTAIKSPGLLNMQYDPLAEGSAIESFHRGSVNCLSYAHLFVATAREAGLKANYQWVDVRPHWTRMGERVAVRLHVNVVVKLPSGGEYMADVDPLEARDITGTHLLSDDDAAALYHSNIAMSALAEDQLAPAWGHAVRAVQLSPEMAHLWVNLGAVYRKAAQHLEAEQSYFYALQLEPDNRSAMNNLAVLYKLQGREAQQQHWQQRIARYQDSNPYFHAWQGDGAGEREDWPLALEHYRRAVALDPHDSRLLYSLGLVYFKLAQFDAASSLISEAIEHATLRRQIDSYQTQLDVVKREQIAAL